MTDQKVIIRETDTILDVLSDLGGFTEVLVVTSSFLLQIFNYQYLNAVHARRLYKQGHNSLIWRCPNVRVEIFACAIRACENSSAPSATRRAWPCRRQEKLSKKKSSHFTSNLVELIRIRRYVRRPVDASLYWARSRVDKAKGKARFNLSWSSNVGWVKTWKIIQKKTHHQDLHFCWEGPSK